ncbi:MAG: hypothetical protein WBD40_24985 [Tepidisphaeraceae bacterium]
MDLQLRIIHANDFLRASPTGELDLQGSKELLLTLAAANKPPADRDILLDLRSASGSKLETLELIALVRMMVDHLVSFQHKLALLIAPDAPGYRAQLVEHLADSRGFNVEVFKDFEQAMTWLMTSTPVSAPATTQA